MWLGDRAYKVLADTPLDETGQPIVPQVWRCPQGHRFTQPPVIDGRIVRWVCYPCGPWPAEFVTYYTRIPYPTPEPTSEEDRSWREAWPSLAMFADRDKPDPGPDTG